MTQLSGEINVQSLVSGDVSSRPTLSVGLTDEVKQALLTIAQKVAYIDEHGQDYYNALYSALYPPAVLLSINAIFTQGSAVIYDSDSLDVLRQYLTVTGLFDDYTTDTIQGYSLSGTLTAGTSTITVSYGGKTTTFSVEVTHRVWAVTSIDAVFTQGSAVIYDNDPLDVLREYLVVTATYENESTAVVTSYSLSGTLTAGTSTITASYGGFSDTFSVTVTERPVTLTSITAVFTQGQNVVYDTDSLDTLKPYLVVTAHYDNNTDVVVNDYTLSGTLAEGTSTITASYGGKTDTFDVTVSVEPLLPAEYQQVEYIKSTGTQHIITDYKFNNTKPNGYVVNADFTFDAWNNTYATNIAISLGGSSSGLWIGYLNGSQKIGMGTNAGMYYDTGTVTDRHTYTYSSDGVDGTWTRDDGATISRTLTQANSFFALFYYRIPSGTQNDFHFVGKLYSCTLSKDGTMLLDLIPCYRKSDGGIGLYDIVNDRFYTNNGSGTFEKGADV